jgi:hypothetical protein
MLRGVPEAVLASQTTLIAFNTLVGDNPDADDAIQV